MWGRMRYILKHSGVCVLGRRHPLSTCYFSFREIYEQVNFGTFFTVLRKIAGRCTSIFFFSVERVLMSLQALKLFLSQLYYSSPSYIRKLSK